MNRVLIRHIILTLMTAALFLVNGTAFGQSDSPYVIKRTNYNNTGDHYLAHVKVGESYVLQDVTAFTPDCIWYSGRDINIMGTHHNYYFIDDANQYRFLSAPLQSGGSLSLSASQPEIYLLNNTDQNYYFYDWDKDNSPYGGGIARGHQYNGVTSETCSFDWRDNQCWEVYWVECDGSSWKLSSNYSYDITANSGRYRPVTVTSFPLVVSGTGGLGNLSDFDMEYSTSITALELSASITPFSYIPAYKKYYFKEVTTPGTSSPAVDPVFQEHTYYFPHGNTNTNPPINTVSSGSNTSLWTYAWSISGPGAQYLSFSATGDFTHASSLASPTLYYRTPNNDGHKTATLTLTVTYQDGSSQTTSCTVTVKTPCQNPQFSANVSYENVVISWTQTAESYIVSYKKETDTDWTEVSVGNVTSHTITGLAYSTTYDYKVKATCDSNAPTASQFTTLAEPEAIVCGAVFGGGRMANVTGNTEVVIINADSIGAVYGGNDIAGQVQGANGSTIVLGVNANDSYSTAYNGNAASTKVRVMDVYGGGNGYYAYNGNSFVAATTTTVGVPASTSVMALSETNEWNIPVWDNPKTTGDSTLTLPSIVKTAITMTNNVVKVDSVFGGAKNAFINAEANTNGTSINVKGGTAFAVYGGNNYGGAQTDDSKHYIKVENTKTNTATYPTGIGRDFGIAYLFGGGNKVAGKTTEVEITGGMCDTVFGGGNAADVLASNITVNCSIASGTAPTFGNTYSNAISSYSSGITINDNYDWNGTGIYNVRTLFGGNNRANMAGLPVITLTSGSVGTVYGGGNAGHMLAHTPDDANPTTNPGTGPLAIDFDPPMVGSTKYPIYYGTHVVMDQANMIVDYLYGGCQMSDVEYSTWVEIKNGHVGTVYGGCNVSGDVGSEWRLDYYSGMPYDQQQLVKGATYVKATGGTVHGDLFAGSNGYYHCNDGIHYIEGHNYTSHNYIGDTIPTHNETHVMVSKDDAANTSALVKGNVYAGGNMAYVGFINETDQSYRFRDFVGFCSVRMDGGTVEGSVYGGGNRASVFGSNEVMVSGGMIGYTVIDTTATDGALYGGNDRAGQVAQISNRVLSSDYDVASDGVTNLKQLGVKTYVGVMGKPKVSTVYGGGNGAYTDYNSGNYCDPSDKPVQSNTFVDINIDAAGGSATGGYINTVYGGGNGVTVLDRITVFVNVQNATANAYDHVGTIFGGNNQGDLDILSDIILLHGQANTVYGGCNSGAMTGSYEYEGYTDVGSVVQLRNQYSPNGTGTPVVPDAKVTGAVYGGCRMNNVTHNSLVLVEGGNHSTANMFGGCDISGTVGDTSRVAVTGGTIGNVYGGGNGNYDYVSGGNVYKPGSEHTAANLVATGITTAPICANSGVDVTGGQVGTTGNGNDRNIFGGGYGQLTSTTGNVLINFNGASAEIYGDVYGGSALGSVNTLDQGYSTKVNILNGTLHGDVYGGGLGQAPVAAQGTPGDPGYTPAVPGIAATVNGKVYVNIGSYDSGTDTYSGNATFGGDVYGCNNLYGSPQDSVFVNIYQTAHTTANSYPSIPNTVVTVPDTLTWLDTINHSLDRYAIRTVYGGGNRAAYTPSLTAQNKRRSSIVHVYQCNSNTVREVFGGGNAADVGTPSVHTDTYVIIDGGRFYHVVGGGNGYSQTNNHSNPSQPNYNPGASINGAANTLVYSGLINEVYGGANILGTVDSINLVMSHSTSCGVPEVYGKVFGCANAADYNRSVTTTIECGVGIIGELYGGSNQANIGTSGQNNADVTLNLYGGTHDKVFAGSKGIAGDQGVPANIYGNVTLNLYGGTVTNAFGGSDANGDIAGVITVNVMDKNVCHPLDVTNIYGASNLTDYNPDVTSGVKPVSPVVNVIHIAQDPGIRGNVYGGGNQATVNANPKVNIGYHHASMAQYIPLDAQGDSLYHVPATPRAYVSGNVFGGGNLAAVTGTDTVNIRRSNSYVNNVFGGGNQAGTTNTVVNVYDGTVNTDVYGGCNTSGTVTGDIKVNLLGGTVSQDVFGGGKGDATRTNGNILVTVDGGITRDVYGGSALGQVNNEATDLTKVWLKSGTVSRNLYGGGMGQTDQDAYGQVNGQVEVLVNGGTVTDVFGCNNLWGMPKSSVKVDIDGNMTINGNVYGGGNQATYGTAGNNYPEVNILNGTLTHDVFGGGLGNAEDPTKGVVTGNPQVTINGANVSVTGNIYGCGSLAPTVGNALVTLTNGATTNIFGGGKAANVTGNPTVTVEGGTVSTGVYGGCHNSGIVDGNITVNIRGDNVNRTTIGTLAALQAGTVANIHGGGYGAGTSTTGNVTVTFGTADASSEYCEYPMLYGDMYGGSALGTINNDASDVTTVTVLNGSVMPAMLGNTQYGGNIYGGGLGDLTHAATVNGEVHVNIGDTLTSIDDRIGKASLRGCNVFGCNNKYGSPQQDVFVHVFQTNHIASDVVEELDGDFAIKTVYGGGNMADYAPTNNPNQSYSLKTHNYIHACDNTVGTVYGGGRAAAADGVETNVDGGRFEYIFGGGNGQIDPANIGWGGIELTVCSGHVGYKYGGCDMGGNVLGVQHDNPCDDGPCNEPLEIGYFFFGANKSTIIGGLMDTIPCSDPPMSYQNVYAGSRLAVIYGDIYMLVRGGEITNLFGGSQGSIDRPGHVRRYPHLDNPDEMALVPSDAYNDMVTYLTVNPTLQGQGGNIYMRIEGGTLCNVYCGNQLYGTVDGDIIVVVDDQEACPLVIDTLYGGNEKAIYEPGNGQTRISPQVYLKNGKINYDVYAGSFGDRLSLIENAGRVHSNPYVMIGSNDNDDHAIVGRNVYGGGSKADVVGNTKVVIRGNATIGDMADGGDVYGGSREGDVNGNTNVEIEPTSISQEIVIPTVPPPALHTITFRDNSASGTEYGTIYVTNSYGIELTSGAQVAQGSVLHVRIVVNSSPNYEFYGWGVTGASVVQPFEFSTAVIIGSGDANLTANFTTSGTNNLTLTLTPNIVGAGSFKVNGAAYTGPVLIPQGFPVTVQALHAENYVFGGWTGLSGLTITNGTTSTSTVTFNMGTSDVDLTANFVPTHTLTLIASPEGACTFTVNDDPYIGTLTIAEGITVHIVATPAAGHEGDSILWTSDNGGTIGSDTSLTFTMGNSNTNVTATFTAPTPP